VLSLLLGAVWSGLKLEEGEVRGGGVVLLTAALMLIAYAVLRGMGGG
jgi:hypothetical protein